MFRERSSHSVYLKLLVCALFGLGISILLLVSPPVVYAAACSSDNRDYGDAPASYGIACGNNDATLRLGTATPDNDGFDGYQSVNADGDDNNGTDDETLANPLPSIDLVNATYAVTVTVRNSTGANASLMGWIDFNGNGTFDNATERVTATVATNAADQQVVLRWTIPGGSAPLATTYVRIRIMPTTTAADLQPTGNFPAEGSFGEVEDYRITTYNSTYRDYGDAPSSYGSASASYTSTLIIGITAPDTEAANNPTTGATGDDTAGTDDENFLNPLTPIDLAYPTYVWTVRVTNTTGANAYLHGWIDFNGNGTFDSNERVIATVASGATQATLTWTIPITASPNITTYARLRLSPSNNQGPTGDSGNGEVEDYQIQTVQSIVCAPGRTFYFIDGAASTYSINTFDISTGANTVVNNPAAQTNINGLGVDQSTGLVYYQDADNSTTPDGIYYYDSVAGTNGTISDDAATAPLNMPLANGWQTASGAYGNGRYYAGVDGADVGTIYEITLNAAGTAPVSARALVTPNPPPCGQTTCQNYGDLIIDGNRMYVAFWSTGGALGETQWIDVYDINSQLRLSRWTNNSTGFAIQFGRDGNGQIYAITSDNGRVFTLNASTGIPDNFPATPLRTIGTIVNDASECPIVPMDFGDAPTSYGWDAGPRAARSGITTTLRLGSTARTIAETRDLHGNSSANADGDDASGVDDEDGISSLPRLRVISTTYTITNVAVFNNTGSNAYAYAWIDFDRDGEFESGERVSVTVPSSASTQYITLTWTGLSGLVYGPSFMRLRLANTTVTTSTFGTGNDGAFLATGYAPLGEVEDYPLSIDGYPTAVTLSFFTSTVNAIPVGDWMLFAALGIMLVTSGGLIVYRAKRTR